MSTAFEFVSRLELELVKHVRSVGGEYAMSGGRTNDPNEDVFYIKIRVGDKQAQFGFIFDRTLDVSKIGVRTALRKRWERVSSQWLKQLQ